MRLINAVLHVKGQNGCIIAEGIGEVFPVLSMQMAGNSNFLIRNLFVHIKMHIFLLTAAVCSVKINLHSVQISVLEMYGLHK